VQALCHNEGVESEEVQEVGRGRHQVAALDPAAAGVCAARKHMRNPRAGGHQRKGPQDRVRPARAQPVLQDNESGRARRRGSDQGPHGNLDKVRGEWPHVQAHARLKEQQAGAYRPDLREQLELQARGREKRQTGRAENHAGNHLSQSMRGGQRHAASSGRQRAHGRRARVSSAWYAAEQAGRGATRRDARGEGVNAAHLAGGRLGAASADEAHKARGRGRCPKHCGPRQDGHRERVLRGRPFLSRRPL